MDNISRNFLPHGNDAYVDANSDAWLDNGSNALRQPHTSNATETLYSQQLTKTSSSFMAKAKCHSQASRLVVFVDLVVLVLPQRG